MIEESKQKMDGCLNNTPLYLGNYDVGANLGAGTYGEVRLARDVVNNRMVALKFIKKSRLPKRVQLERANTESRLMGLLDHENLCKLHDNRKRHIHNFGNGICKRSRAL
jgi:serine/threonine protein kinase